MANLAFSLLAALTAACVSVLAAAKGATAVAVVFGLLAAGFLVRAGEWRGRGR